MSTLKLAKDGSIPALKHDGSNYEEWRVSFLGYYSGRADFVFQLAVGTKIEDVKVSEEDKRLLTSMILSSIDVDLRRIYVQQIKILCNGFLLWTTLEQRFQREDAAERDLSNFLNMKQGSNSLLHFLVEYENLRQRLPPDFLAKVMDEESNIRHLRRAISRSSRGMFLSSRTSYSEFYKELLEDAKEEGIEEDAFKSSAALGISQPTKEKRCFRCGKMGHFVATCPNKVRCFKCQGEGHISKDCPKG